MKKLNLVIYTIILSLLLIVKVNAESIKEITMDIYVDNEGNAKIQEIWKGKFDKNTELYHPYFNLGNSKITMDSVYDDLGNTYTINDNWNIKASFASKAKRFGIYKDGSEVDICWGITEYGNRTYTVNYNISNFIYNTTDGYQILFWQLIPYDFSSSIGRAYIKVHSDFSYEDTLEVWGYGNKGGYAYVYDGYIEMESKGSLSTSEYMTMLVKFPKGTFDTTNKINKSWDQVFDGAEEGADKYNPTKDNILIVIFSIISSLFPFIFIILISIIAAKSTNGGKKIKNKVIPKKKDLLPFRDLPCKDDYFLAYLLTNEYSLNNSQTDILGALILKWIKDGNVNVTTEEKGIFKNKETKIELIKEPENASELDLYKILSRAADDNILENNEFKKYCRNHYSTVLAWFDNALSDEFKEIRENPEYITKEEKKTFLGNGYNYNATDKTNELAKEMAGLKLFFKEFTSMHDKTAIEVKMWREYLIYAQILGMAKEVAKEFKDLYPDVITDNDYNSVILIHDFSRSGVSAATSARSRAQSYSSGGGGFSSGGGGGGSFGGGGGGGGSR